MRKYLKFSLKNFPLNTVKNTRNVSNGIVKPSLSNVVIPEVSIPNFIWEKTSKFSQLTAVECFYTKRKYSYDDLYKKSRNFSGALKKKVKLQSGSTVAILLPNIPEYVICMLGALQCGFSVTTMNPNYTAHEISRQLTDSNSSCIITIPELLKSTVEAISDSKKDIPIISISKQTEENVVNFFELSEVECDGTQIFDALDINKAAVLPYSSGTTGLPKGVELSHRNIVANLCQMNHPDHTLYNETSNAEDQDIIPSILPMFHIYGLNIVTLCSLAYGARLVTLPKFVPDDFLSLLSNYKPSILYLVPPIIQYMTHDPRITAELIEKLRYTISGAAPLGVHESEKFLNRFNSKVKLTQGYGMTETSPIITMTPLNNEKVALGSIGKVIPNTECKVRNLENGSLCKENEKGELMIRGPQVMLGYHNNKQATEEILDSEGWLRTGDVVYYDENENFFVADRIKELIKVKGFQVAPAELEDILCSHENVADAAVIGIADEKNGELPKAFVVKKQGSELNEEELKNFIKNLVAPYKQLEGGVVFVDRIPKSAAGKILRRELKNL